MYGLLLIILTPAQINTEDKTLKEALKKATYYDHKLAYQHDKGVHDVKYNISAVKTEPFGNPNIEFPWGASGGTHRTKMKIKKFHYFPSAITWEYKDLPKRRYTAQIVNGEEVNPGYITDYVRSVSWTYPNGTIFGELFHLHQGNLFEIRLRHKVDGKWNPSVYRPILNREEYDEALQDRTMPNVQIMSLKSGHATNAFKAKAAVDILPAISDSLVTRLLAKPFRRVTGPWITKKGIDGFAPTTEADFHIIPKNYDAAFISPDRKGCMLCHNDVLREAGDFDIKRDWYGRVRGSDGIFSFSIFDDSSISSNGMTIQVKINENLHLKQVYP